MSNRPRPKTLPASPPRVQRESLGRIAFTIAEAALALGVRPAALRRLIERHARAEGDETVARLTGGIVARRRKGLRRWLVVIPAELRG